MVLHHAVRRHGLGTLFSSQDARHESVRGLWPGPDLRSDEKLLRATEALRKCLVSEAYGGVRAARQARDAYNDRRVCSNSSG